MLSKENCCGENFLTLEEVKLKYKILKEVDPTKALLKSIHLNQKGHYQYHYIDCTYEPCKCYLLDINNKVLHPDLDLEDNLLNNFKSCIKSNEKKHKQKNKSKSPGM